MIKFILIFCTLLLSGFQAFAADSDAPSPAVLAPEPLSVSTETATPPASYTTGMEQRKRGEYAAAKQTFLQLLAQTPSSGGALEGLSLTCMALGQYEEALGYLERWNEQSPHSPYILGLLARAQNRMWDSEGALQTYADQVACDSTDCVARRNLDSSMEQLRAGAFPWGKTSKSYSMEGLDTRSPQRILYEGHSGGSRFRVPLKRTLDLIGGVEIREEAQRNDSRDFTYYDILDQVYTAGLSARPSRRFNWEAEYGQSVLSDIKASGVGNQLFSRARLAGKWHAYDSDFSLILTRAPKFVRGAGGTQYFKMLRESAARAEAQTSLWNWNWLARTAMYNTSDGTTLGTFSLRGLREFGNNLFQSGYSHGQQEFYGASAEGHLRYVNTDRFNVNFRHTIAERYRLDAAYAHTAYSDNNRLNELDGALTAWLARNTDFYGTYRFSLQNFRAPYEGYTSADTRAHWLGAYWRRCHGRNWSAMLGYERGFLNASSRGSYQGNNYLAEVEWYHGANASVRAQAAKSDTTKQDRSYSAGLQARYSFK